MSNEEIVTHPEIVPQPIQPNREDEEAMIKCLNWTPLHVAASLGRLEESHIALLNGNPALAEALDSQQRSLLHLASANGHTDVVGQLLQVRPEMCLARDRDGQNPLHAAAMRGQIQVLGLLFNANPDAARARVDSGHSILHLCVKYGQLPFLGMLLFKVKELVDAVDNDGNTILHLAVASRNFKIVRHLLCFTSISINKINANKQTAMDVLLLRERPGSPLAEEDGDIHEQSFYTYSPKKKKRLSISNFLP